MVGFSGEFRRKVIVRKATRAGRKVKGGREGRTYTSTPDGFCIRVKVFSISSGRIRVFPALVMAT